MPCPECELTRKQYLNMQRTALQLAHSLDHIERGRRLKNDRNPSLTELVALVER
jgi:hypothetical protein